MKEYIMGMLTVASLILASFLFMCQKNINNDNYY